MLGPAPRRNKAAPDSWRAMALILGHVNISNIGRERTVWQEAEGEKFASRHVYRTRPTVAFLVVFAKRRKFQLFVLLWSGSRYSF